MTCFSIQFSFRIVCPALMGAIFCMFLMMAAPVMAQGPIVLPTQATAPAPENRRLKAQAEMAEDMLDAARQREKNMRAEAPILVELFTSKDCTACVYADRMLYEAMQDKFVIGLSCQIQDLNSITVQSEDSSIPDGPIDMCAFRQWTYKARRQTKDVILTIPTFFFNGTDSAGMANPYEVQSYLDSYHYLGFNKSLEILMRWKDNRTITLSLPEQRLQGEYDSASVWIIRYKDTSIEKIDEGMNKDRVLRFTNIVQYIRHIGKWHGSARSIDIIVPPPTGGDNRGGYVAIIQEMMGEPVLASGRLEDYPLPGEKAQKRPRVADPRTITAPLPPTEVPKQ